MERATRYTLTVPDSATTVNGHHVTAVEHARLLLTELGFDGWTETPGFGVWKSYAEPVTIFYIDVPGKPNRRAEAIVGIGTQQHEALIAVAQVIARDHGQEAAYLTRATIETELVTRPAEMETS